MGIGDISLSAWAEDEDGNGEYKLTVFFTKHEAPA